MGGLLAKTIISFEVTDSGVTSFKSGQVAFQNSSASQGFGADVLLEDGDTKDISLQGVTKAQQVFIQCSQEVYIKLIPFGQTASSTPALTLLPGAPSILSVNDLAGIQVTNTSGNQARLIVEGVGV